MARAGSWYQQLQLTVTQERSGILSARVLVKPYTASWTQKDVVWAQRWRPDVLPQHWVSALLEAAGTIAEQPTLSPSPPGAPWPPGAPLGGLRGVPSADDTVPPDAETRG